MRPKNDTLTRLRAVGDLCLDASEMQGIPDRRRMLLLQMREWVKFTEVPSSERFNQVAALEAEIKAIRAYCEVDRRVHHLDPRILAEPYPGSGMYRTLEKAPEIPDA